MAGLDFRDLDQWIVDLDVLQQELKTVKVKRSSSSLQNRPNGWSSSSALLFANGNQKKSGQSAVAIANLPPNHSNQSAERTGPPEFISLERDILYHKSVSPSKLRTIPTTTDYRKHVCEPSPNENGLKVRYRINAASHNSYVCTNQKKGSRNLSRSGTLREQKSVHWSSEINSSTSPSNPKDGTCSPVSSDKKSSLSPPVNNNVTTRGNKLQMDSSFPADSSHRRRQGEPLEHNTASGTSRPDVIVTRSHSIKSAERVPSRSAPFPSKLTFPMSLADFAKQKSVINNADITNVRNDLHQYSLNEFQPPYNCFPVSEPFRISNHSIPVTMSPYEQYKQIPFTQSMVRSQSSVGKLHGFGNEKQFVLQDDRLKYEGYDGIYYGPKRRPQRSLSMHHSTAGRYNGIPIQKWDPADLYPFKPPEVVPNKHTDKLILRVYHPNRTTKAVSVGPDTTTLNVIEILLEKSNLAWSTKFALVEKIPSMKLERCFEDDELIMDCLGNWTVGCENLVFFEERQDVYGMFEDAQLWLGNRVVSSEYADSENLVKEFFTRNNELNLPSVSEYLYVQTKDSEWKRRFCLLRNSGLYISKHNSNSIAAYQLLVSFKPYLHLYTTTGGWSKMKAPTPYGFTVKPCSSKVLDIQFTVHLCAPSETSLRMWYSLIRIALVGENLVRNYQNRQRLSNPLGIPICRPLSLFSTSLFDYHKPTEDKCNSPPDHQQFSTYPPNLQHPLQSHTTHLNMQVLPCSRPDVTDGRVSHQATKERCITLSTSSDSQPPQTCTDPDATTGDASSIGWSASGSGCGLVGTSNPMGQRNTPSGLGCVSGRTDVRAPRHSLSVSDLTQTVETTHTHTNCASSLTSLFLCTVNSDKRATQQYCNPSPNPQSDTGRARSKTVVKRLFGGGPSARRCNIGRSVSNISTPFNVSVPPWVRTSMNDLTLQVPSTNHLTMY